MNTQSNSIFQKKSIRALVGLGNPGNRFLYTRHNIGFLFLDYCAEVHNAQWHTQENLMYTTISLPERNSPVYLIKPQTFMNESGRIAPFLQKKGIKPEELVVVQDELEKKFGACTLSYGGSPRGHNGIKSLQALFGQSFWRLRIGIDRPEEHSPEAVGAYVLGSFTQENKAQFPDIFNRAVQMLF